MKITLGKSVVVLFYDSMIHSNDMENGYANES